MTGLVRYSWFETRYGDLTSSNLAFPSKRFSLLHVTLHN